MNKQIKTLAAAVLLLCLSITAVACGRTAAPKETRPGATTLPVETTEAPVVPDTQTTEPVDTTSPTLDIDTGVGSGRVEGVGGQQETTPPTTQPPATEPQPDVGLSLSYQQYMKLSNDQQQALYDQYFSDDPLAFAAWFQKIKQEYDDEKQEVIATGPVDIEDYINPTP